MSECSREAGVLTPFSEDATGCLVDGMLGDGEWTGNNTFQLLVVDEENAVAYGFEIRKGSDWITIMKRVSENMMLGTFFNLELNESGEWEYIDPKFLKHGESSIDELAEVFRLLTIASAASGQDQLRD